MYPTRSEQKGVACLAYSRGCPYGCSYCASKSIWGKIVKWRSAKNTVDELKQVQRRFGTNTAFFTDLTFNLEKDKVLELCREITEQKISVNWYAMLRIVSPDGSLLVDEELLDAMKKAGCSKIGYGLESLIPEIQEKYDKRGEINILEQVLDYGNQIGIINKAFLIIGEPRFETRETLELTKELLRGLSLDELRISFLTPFPNTLTCFESKQEKRMLTKDWSRYTSDEPILKADNLTREELVEAREEIFKDFYQNPNYEKRIRFKVKRFPHLKKSYEEYFEFLEKKGVYK
jgi:radical SAM superfamily enzyme YgiQ (UPF0313 family)